MPGYPVPDYIERIVEDVGMARTLKLVIDCGGGCPALVAPDLFRALGCEVAELGCEVETSAPARPADPSRPENLKALQQVIVKDEGKSLSLRTECTGACGKTFKAVGVAIPPTIREI